MINLMTLSFAIESGQKGTIVVKAASYGRDMVKVENEPAWETMIVNMLCGYYTAFSVSKSESAAI